MKIWQNLTLVRQPSKKYCVISEKKISVHLMSVYVVQKGTNPKNLFILLDIADTTPPIESDQMSLSTKLQ